MGDWQGRIVSGFSRTPVVRWRVEVEVRKRLVVSLLAVVIRTDKFLWAIGKGM